MNDQPRRKPSDADDIGALIRIAGERPPVPAERFERVRAAAREAWQRDMAARSRRRVLWTTAGLATAASLVLMVSLRILMFDGGLGGAGGPIVERAHGVVSPAVQSGDRLQPDTDLETGARGRVALRLPSGHGIRVDQGTRVRMTSASELELLDGTIYVDSDGHRSDRTDRTPLTIATVYGQVEEIGTQFEVRVRDGALRVRLREGEVRIHRDADTHELIPGDQLEIDARGRVSRAVVPIYGELWAWSESLTNLPRVEGRPALEFLEWVARERGWTLVFDGEQAARVAGEAVLGGNVESLTVEQALDAVLSTCGLTYERSPGTLTVRVDDI